MMPWRAHGLVLLLAGALGAAGGWPPDAKDAAFPHEKHARLFPVCEGCHAGIVTGEAARAFPSGADCARCHDGARQPRVEWRDPLPRVSNLRFAHTRHAQLLSIAADSASCLSCHAATNPPQRMVVRGPDPSSCVRCHAHRGEAHLAPQAACRTCHVPVASAAALSVARIGRFPRPDWHDAPDFQGAHGRTEDRQAESCAICHARETCERCHANADGLTRVTALARDPRVAELESGKSPRYAAPASHDAAEWRTVHGAEAIPSAATCANCHTRASCDACHAGGTGSSRTAIASLPAGGNRPGLGVSATLIDRAVHPGDMIRRHGAMAATAGATCAQCHSEQACAGCHAASDSRRFHATNFVERHATDVFSGGADCQSCHNTERFCRDCHARTGIAAEGRMNAAFHTGKANWVLSHGQAARTGMASCAACHRQADCVRCHSASGGWGVNPHGRGFRADARGASNPASCRWCHLGPLPGGR